MAGSFGSLVPMLVGVLLVVLIAAGGAIFLVRRFGAGGGREGAARGRPSRLAMVDSTPIIDGRKLVIVRRDNVEHLLLIGGATDVLVEGNIVRAGAHASVPPLGDMPAHAAEPEPPARVAAPEPVARTPEPQSLPLAEGAKWPLAPEPMQRSKRSSEDGVRWPLQAQNEPIAHPAEPRPTEPAPAAMRSVEPEPAAAKQPTPVAEDAKAKEDAALPTDHFAELAAALQRPAGAETKPPSPVRPSAPLGTAAEGNLTDMAHRVEAALRRPISAPGATTPPPRLEPRRPVPSFAATPPAPRPGPTVDLPRMPPRLTPEPRQASEPAAGSEPQITPDLRIAPEPRVAPEPRLAAEPRPASEPKPEGSPTDTPAFESLEREMASLLGRPPR